MYFKNFLHKHRQFIMRLLILGTIAVILVFVIPIFINYVYQQPARFPLLAMEWDGKDALSFYGSLLGATATIFVLWKTIKFTVNNQKEERKLAVKPYLETKKYNYTKLEDIPTENDIICLGISKHLITYQGAIPDSIAKLKEERSLPIAPGPIAGHERSLLLAKERALFQSKYFLSYEIVNCGAGNAIDVSLYINGKQPIPSFCITTTSPKKLLLMLDNDLIDQPNGEYSLKLRLNFKDVVSLAEYYQTEELIFHYDTKSKMKTIQKTGGLLTKPIEIPKTISTHKN